MCVYCTLLILNCLCYSYAIFVLILQCQLQNNALLLLLVASVLCVCVCDNCFYADKPTNNYYFENNYCELASHPSFTSIIC